ncbi:MbtH family protein [Streptomyces sp. NPDC055189]
MADAPTDERTYRVVLNDEEQYSIWPADRDVPAGWRAEGTEGAREACLSHIGEIWTDMRPRSLRQRMESAPAA